MVFDEGIIGLFALPWKQALKFDNNITIMLTIYNLKASHGDQGWINVNPKSMIHDDEPISTEMRDLPMMMIVPMIKVIILNMMQWIIQKKQFDQQKVSWNEFHKGWGMLLIGVVIMCFSQKHLNHKTILKPSNILDGQKQCNKSITPLWKITPRI